jgi:DNA-binding transcriptional MerR regulator
MAKSPDAFRTISEVAADLDVPQHVLRFWETKFSQIKPLKRAGGRRYYRPEDVDLLRGIRVLLYTDGFTIKGVQKVFREQGVRIVSESGKAKGGNGARPAAHAVLQSVPLTPALTQAPALPLEQPAKPKAAEARGSEAKSGAALETALAQLTEAKSLLGRRKRGATAPTHMAAAGRSA